jgi:hypothetical protein
MSGYNAVVGLDQNAANTFLSELFNAIQKNGAVSYTYDNSQLQQFHVQKVTGAITQPPTIDFKVSQTSRRTTQKLKYPRTTLCRKPQLLSIISKLLLADTLSLQKLHLQLNSEQRNLQSMPRANQLSR